MSKIKFALMGVLLLLLNCASLARSAENITTQPIDCVATTKQERCNLAWKDGCRVLSMSALPVCRASAKLSNVLSLPIGTWAGAGSSAQPIGFAKETAASNPNTVTTLSKKLDGHALELLGGMMSPAETNIAPDKRKVADEILFALEQNPLSNEAQGRARDIIRTCDAGARTPAQMFTCSGFFVPPMVRLNCLGNGQCMPLPWGGEGVSSGFPEWALQAAYERNDVSNNPGFAYARPWVASEKDVKACASQAKKHLQANNDHVFSNCLVQRMGGESAKLALKCYKTFPNSPSRFSGCISKVEISPEIAAQADCWSRMDTGLKCLNTYNLPKERVKNCQTASAGDVKALQNCMAGLPRIINPLSQCANAYLGDFSTIGHCMAGIASSQKSTTKKIAKQVRVAHNCISGIDGAASKSNSELQREVLHCAGEMNAGVAGLASSVDKLQVATACLREDGTDLASRANCLRAAGVPFPQEVELAECVTKASTAIELGACTGSKDTARVAAARQCLDKAGENKTALAICIGTQIDLPPDQRKVLQCAATSRNEADGLICLTGDRLPPSVSKILACGVNSQGNYMAAALCVAGPEMNAELRIASECIATSGGVPLTFAACAGGRLTMKELQQCIAGGFKAESGCFGDGNEIVKFYKAQEELLRDVLKAAGLERAYNDMLKDLKSGRLGENNDIRRVVTLMNDIATMPPAEAARRAVEEAKRAGVTIIEGTSKLNEEIAKVAKKLDEEIQNALPKAPPVLATTDIPGGGTVSVGAGGVSASTGDVSVTVGPVGGGVNVGNSGINVNPGGGSTNVKVAGVCIGWGC